MKLGDFLKQGRPSATRTVTLRVLGVTANEAKIVADAKAEIVCVSERERQEALREADEAVRKLYGGDPPEDRRSDERMYHVLHRVLRDVDDHRQPFADSVIALKNAFVRSEAVRAWSEYVGFLDEEFPEAVDAETFAKLVQATRTAFLPDMISSFGFDAVRRSMPGLLALLRTSSPVT